MSFDREQPVGPDDPWDEDLREMVSYLRRAAQSELQSVAQPAPEATSLVNRAIVRLLGGRARFQPRDAEHLRRTAARAIRFVLRDILRHKKTQKAGGSEVLISIQAVEGDLAVSATDEHSKVEAWLDAIETFSAKAPDPGAIVEAQYLLGLSTEQVCHNLGISDAQVQAANLMFAEHCARDEK